MPQPFIENPFPDGTDLHEVTRRLLARPSVPPILPGKPYDAEIAALLTHLMQAGSPDVLLTYNVAGCLHLLNDDLDRAHVLVQAHEDDPTANYVHQIVHRREGDFSNARYWVAKTGRHPFYEALFEEAKADAEGGSLAESLQRWTRWEGGRMVELCEAAASASGGPTAEKVARLAWREMQGLLAWCVRTGA